MEYLPILMLLSLLVFFFTGYPIAFILGGIAVIFGTIGVGFDILSLLPMRIWGRVNNIILIAVPFFIIMGIILERTGISEELLDTLGKLFKNVRGGVPLSLLAVGTILAATTGLVGAVVVTVGSIALPGMLKQGYSQSYSTGSICAVGTLGQIIPPSIILVLLGDVVGVSVGELFAGALVPGFFLVLLYGLYMYWDTRLHPPVADLNNPAVVTDKETQQNMWVLCSRTLVPPALLIVGVLGSIFLGIASPTEAAAVGAFGSLIIAIFKKRINMKSMKEIAVAATKLNAMVFLILIGATAFGLVFRMIGGDDLIRNIFFSLDIGKYGILALIMLIIFILGFFLEVVEIIFIFVPLLAPIVLELGFNPLWICIMICINLQTAFLTPPMGFAIIYLKAVCPTQVKTTDIYKGVIPYIVLQVVALIFFMVFPEIATWLPSLLFK
ncbi:MAG: TRAP transporter large permease subunit [Deltaproteobacteria bacterium]|nr:TRAP transporter large permease subunit [Deltaproteobacteria bacterium]